MSKIFFDKIPVLKVNDEVNETFKSKVLDIQCDYTNQKVQEIDSMLFDLYKLSNEERETVGFIEIK